MSELEKKLKEPNKKVSMLIKERDQFKEISKKFGKKIVDITKSEEKQALLLCQIIKEINDVSKKINFFIKSSIW